MSDDIQELLLLIILRKDFGNLDNSIGATVFDTESEFLSKLQSTKPLVPHE